MQNLNPNSEPSPAQPTEQEVENEATALFHIYSSYLYDAQPEHVKTEWRKVARYHLSKMREVNEKLRLTQGAWEAQIKDLQFQLASKDDHFDFMEGEKNKYIAGLQAELREKDDKHERDMLRVIDEREDAAQSLSQAYYLITGNSPEWSNLFGHQQALMEIDETVNLLKQAVKDSQSQLAAKEKKLEDVKYDLQISIEHTNKYGGIIIDLREQLAAKEREVEEYSGALKQSDFNLAARDKEVESSNKQSEFYRLETHRWKDSCNQLQSRLDTAAKELAEAREAIRKKDEALQSSLDEVIAWQGEEDCEGGVVKSFCDTIRKAINNSGKES